MRKKKSRELWVIDWTPPEHTEHLPQYGREVGLRPNQATESTEQHLSFVNWQFLSNFAAAVLFGSLDIFPLQYPPKGKVIFPRMANARKWHDPHSTPSRWMHGLRARLYLPSMISFISSLPRPNTALPTPPLHRQPCTQKATNNDTEQTCWVSHQCDI